MKDGKFIWLIVFFNAVLTIESKTFARYRNIDDDIFFLKNKLKWLFFLGLFLGQKMG